jgi:hypothetical protein
VVADGEGMVEAEVDLPCSRVRSRDPRMTMGDDRTITQQLYIHHHTVTHSARHLLKFVAQVDKCSDYYKCGILLAKGDGGECSIDPNLMTGNRNASRES